MSQLPIPSPPQTRQKTSTTTVRKTQKELENADELNTDVVRSKEQAIAFLTSKEYLIPGKSVDLQTLSHVLLQFGNAAVKMPKALTDRIRAVAFLLIEAISQQMAAKITATVKMQLQEYIEAFTANVETMRDTVEHVTGAAREITGKMDDFKDGFQESAEQLA